MCSVTDPDNKSVLTWKLFLVKGLTFSIAWLTGLHLAPASPASQLVNNRLTQVGKFFKQLVSTKPLKSHRVNSSRTQTHCACCQTPLLDFRVQRLSRSPFLALSLSLPPGLQITLHPHLRHFSSDTHPDFIRACPSAVRLFV